jgi:3-oxoacyl-[acyl-carrier protein] reductase
MDLGLRDRVYVITGASRGLGLAAARVLVAEGARVVLTGRDGPAVTAAAAELGGNDVARALAADNADPAAASRAVAAARDAFGRLDGALISGPSPRVGHLDEVTEQDWRDAFESVFLGALRMARTVAEATGPGGSIALVLSTTVRVPIAQLSISTGLRPGLAMMVQLLADELGPAGIRVNGLLPGRITTDSLREIDEAPGAAPPSGAPVAVPDGTGARPYARARDRAALRRDADPEEFARLAAFVLSPSASYVTGSGVVMDGGSLRIP